MYWPLTEAESLRYDLINLGREMLAQLATPISKNFSDALSASPIDVQVRRSVCNQYAINM